VKLKLDYGGEVKWYGNEMIVVARSNPAAAGTGGRESRVSSITMIKERYNAEYPVERARVEIPKRSADGIAPSSAEKPNWFVHQAFSTSNFWAPELLETFSKILWAAMAGKQLASRSE
jgi:hypothetical protein